MRFQSSKATGPECLWILIGSYVFFAITSFAFLPDSKLPHPRISSSREGESFGGFRPMESSLDYQRTSFGAIKTRILMVGPLLDDEDGTLAGESSSSGSTSFHVSGGVPRCASNGSRAITAHGILCPETVSKMDQTTQGGRSNSAVKAFLDRYRRYGPMSCMELLSDPEILPHLTMAMRGLA